MKADIGRFYGRGVRLSAVEATDAKAPVWMQIAKEGKYKGHPDFPEVDFTRPVLESVITNFRKHPAYVAGKDGLGSAKVVPFDYEHASELDPTSGSIPLNGAPAPAWVLELQVRDAEDGTAELWALTQLGDQARAQIQKGEYQWTSVAVWRNAVHPVTGEPIGPVLTSVALTNHPFIQGMQALAASARGAGRVLAEAHVYGKAESPEEAIIGLRGIFGLDPNAAPDAILEQMTKFGEFVAAGAFPMGIDAEYIMRRMRELFDLPTLAGWPDIVAAAGGFLSGLLSNAGEQLADASDTENDMAATTTLASQLVGILKCRDNDDSILAAAKETAAAGDALDKLKQLFGSSDVQSLLTDAAGLVAKVGEMGGLVAALTDAAKAMGGGDMTPDEKRKMEEEAGAAMAALNVRPELAKQLEPIIRLAVVTVREHALATAEAEAVLAAIAAKDKDMAERMRPIVVEARCAAIGKPERLAQFRKSFPLQSAQTQLLTRPIFAAPGGTQLGGPATGLDTHSVTQPAGGAPGQPGELPTHIAMQSGRNNVEKAAAYLSAKLPGFDKLPLHDRVFQAGKYLNGGAQPL
jgi:hypothetical protein